MESGSSPSRRERAARLALWALVLAFPAAYLPRLLQSGPAEPGVPPPSWVHLVVVTASRWPAATDVSLPGLAELERAATRPRQAYTSTPASAGAAASLWTGRFAAHHGVLANDRALAPGAWTLAGALAASGARTAAFLQEPFVSATGIGGFERVHETLAQDGAALASAAADFLAEDRERACVWVHLADAGPGGSEVGRVLERLFAALDADGRRTDALLVVTGFGTDAPEADGASDRSLRVPLWIALPSALYAGRSGGGAASLVDLAGVLREALRLPRPVASAGEAPLQSRPEVLAPIVKGAGGFGWLFVHAPGRTLLRFGKTRVVGQGDPPRHDALSVQQIADPTQDTGFVPAPQALRAELERQFVDLDARVRAGAVPSVAAAVPVEWRGRYGW